MWRLGWSNPQTLREDSGEVREGRAVPEEFVVLQAERVELAVLAFAIHFEAVEEFCLIVCTTRVVNILLDHAVVLLARRYGLDLAVECVVVDIDRVWQSLRFSRLLGRVLFLELINHASQRVDEFHLLLDLLVSVDGLVGHLTEAEVVRNEGVELTAQSEDLVHVLLAKRRAAFVVATDAFEKVLDLGKIFVALQDGLLRKLTDR